LGRKAGATIAIETGADEVAFEDGDFVWEFADFLHEEKTHVALRCARKRMRKASPLRSGLRLCVYRNVGRYN